MFCLRANARPVSGHPSISSRANKVTRVLTNKGMDAESKLRHVFEEYRRVHFTQEVPTRFKKEVAKAATKSTRFDGGHRILQADLERVLVNVGGHGRLRPCELETIFNIHGKRTGELTAQQLVRIL